MNCFHHRRAGGGISDMGMAHRLIYENNTDNRRLRCSSPVRGARESPSYNSPRLVGTLVNTQVLSSPDSSAV
jgi:hypothetical protein